MFNPTPTSKLDDRVIREDNGDYNALFDADYCIPCHIYENAVGFGVTSSNAKLTKLSLTQTCLTLSDVTTGV
jgi:hypothetical protein